MPKFNKIQASFNAGEVSLSVYGRVDNERYDQALAGCLNYLPIVQGPLIRRPGTKYVASVKDPSKPPSLIPFQFSAAENYILEFGDRYVRFFKNEAQITTGTTVFQVSGVTGAQPYNTTFWATRFDTFGGRDGGLSGIGIGETITGSSVITPGAALEIQSPYDQTDVANIKFTQKQDVLYMVHPNYPPYRLERHSAFEWTIKPTALIDGPYLPLNTYQSLADSALIALRPATTGGVVNLFTDPSYRISGITNGSSGMRVTTATTHNFLTGQKVAIQGVFGTVEANNATTINSNTITACVAWTINVISGTQFDLLNSTLANGYVGSGTVYPALFVMNSTGSWADSNLSKNVSRPLGLVTGLGTRISGRITSVVNAYECLWTGDYNQSITSTSSSALWYMGCYNLVNGFPTSTCFHQDRLAFAGHANIPQQIDLSMTSQYEVFSASGSNFQVSDNNAMQFTLNSQDQNQIKWLKSNSQGLLAGTQSAEWAVTPSSQQNALTPTNIKADSVSSFGSYDTDALPVGNAMLHVQRAQRKIRELLYFWQVGNFRSTNLSELSEHITLPSVIKLSNQRETHPTVWGLRSDGQLISMCYSRDDIGIKAGWARHQLGGNLDSAGNAPTVNSIASIPSSDTSFDELWMVVRRFMNGSNACTVEYVTKTFDENTAQASATYLDCGGTYSPLSRVTGITNASSCVIQAPGSLPVNSTMIRFYSCVGMNLQTTDINGNITSSNVFNYQTFMIASANLVSGTFKLTDFQGNDINTNSCSIYIGSAIIRTLKTQATGFTWLAGETVGVLADGSVHVNTTVSQTGVVNLAFPAAVIQVGYTYNSDLQMLRTKDGSAQGTGIGTMRRCNRVAFMMSHVGDLQYGSSFNRLIPLEFYRTDALPANAAPPLFTGIKQEGLEAPYGFTDTVVVRQNTGLPGMINSITRFVEQNDV